MIIAFSGPSGSGKTTIINELKKHFFKKEHVIIKEEDSFFTIKLLKKLLGNNIFSKYKDEKYFNKSEKSVSYKIFNFLTYATYPIIVYAEFFVDYIKYELIFKDSVFIIDKFIYDHAVNFKNILMIDNKLVTWLFDNFPKPYLAFLIDINLVNASLKRNKNNIPGKVTAKSSLHQKILLQYKKIASKQNLIVINNNGSFSDAIEKVVSYINNKEKLLNAKRIAICGLDGAGKTTVANLLAKYAESLNIKCKMVHFVHNNLLYRLLLILGYYNRGESRNELYKRSRAHSAKERVKRTSFIKAFLRFFDSYIQYLFYVVMNRNKLIIFDRFFYDYSVSFEYLGIPKQSFFNQSIPTVKNKFLFNVSPEISYKRKPERVKAFFNDCHKLYLKIAKKQHIKIINVDNKKPELILQELMGSL